MFNSSNFIENLRILSSSLRIEKTLLSQETDYRVDVPSGASTFDSVFQILGLLVLFIIIIIAAYYVTKWTSKLSAGVTQTRNITIIETFKISTTKYVQIIKIADKYIAIGVSKDNITMLGEVNPESLLETSSDRCNLNFKSMLDNLINKEKKDIKDIESDMNTSDKEDNK